MRVSSYACAHACISCECRYVHAHAMSAPHPLNICFCIHVQRYTCMHICTRLANRTAKQIRERWHNHLDPVINKGPWTEHEDKLLIVAQNMLGNRFAEIAKLVCEECTCAQAPMIKLRARAPVCIQSLDCNLRIIVTIMGMGMCMRACVCAGAREDRQSDQKQMARDL
jgi:hypothetical protein